VSASFLFEDLPRAALLVLLAGLVVRFYGLLRRPLEDGSSAPPRRSRFGRLGAQALIVVTLAHLAALAVPQALLKLTGVPLRLYLLEGSGFLIGALAALAWVRVMVQHLRRSEAALADVPDAMLLALVAVALGSGLVTAVVYRWGSLWGVATLTPYVRSLGRGRPLGLLAAQMPFPVQLHLISTFAALAVLPFSRLSLVLLAPVHRVARRLSAWLWQPVRATGRYARGLLARLNPAAWIWPEEE
jgi:nitrate reductase gamma subunit